MKKIYALFLATISILLTTAQNPIPNPGFETYWPSSPGQPNGWTDSRDVSQGSPGHSGFQALLGAKSANTYPAFVTGSGGAGIPITTTYSWFNLWYKFNSVASDDLFISVDVRAGGATIGSGIMAITASASSWTFLSIPINYAQNNPTNVVISIVMNSHTGGVATVGSSFMLDDLSLGFSPTAVGDIEKETMALRIFPNPATNNIQIQTEGLKEKDANVQIMDMTGRIVQEINGVDFSDGHFSVPLQSLPSGNYTVAVKNEEMIQTKRLVIEHP